MTGELDAFSDQDQPVIFNVLRWLGMLVLSFDGGVLTSAVQSVAERSGGGVSIRWDNGITHSMSDKDWDRPTRNALDYIMKRSCSVDSFQTNILAGLSGMHHYFKYYNSQLMDQVSFLQGVGDMSPQALVGDASLTFLVLSSLPVATLQTFYQEFSTDIPADLYFDGLPNAVSVQAFFSQPMSDTMLVIDKVKMHYNLANHATLPSELATKLTEKTDEFLLQIRQDAVVWPDVQSEITQVCKEQFEPRLQFLTMVLDVFDWPE